MNVLVPTIYVGCSDHCYANIAGIIDGFSTHDARGL